MNKQDKKILSMPQINEEFLKINKKIKRTRESFSNNSLFASFLVGLTLIGAVSIVSASLNQDNRTLWGAGPISFVSGMTPVMATALLSDKMEKSIINRYKKKISKLQVLQEKLEESNQCEFDL